MSKVLPSAAVIASLKSGRILRLEMSGGAIAVRSKRNVFRRVDLRLGSDDPDPSLSYVVRALNNAHRKVPMTKKFKPGTDWLRVQSNGLPWSAFHVRVVDETGSVVWKATGEESLRKLVIMLRVVKKYLPEVKKLRKPKKPKAAPDKSGAEESLNALALALEAKFPTTNKTLH